MTESVRVFLAIAAVTVSAVATDSATASPQAGESVALTPGPDERENAVPDVPVPAGPELQVRPTVAATEVLIRVRQDQTVRVAVGDRAPQVREQNEDYFVRLLIPAASGTPRVSVVRASLRKSPEAESPPGSAQEILFGVEYAVSVSASAVRIRQPQHSLLQNALADGEESRLKVLKSVFPPAAADQLFSRAVWMVPDSAEADGSTSWKRLLPVPLGIHGTLMIPLRLTARQTADGISEVKLESDGEPQRLKASSDAVWEDSLAHQISDFAVIGLAGTAEVSAASSKEDGESSKEPVLPVGWKLLSDLELSYEVTASGNISSDTDAVPLTYRCTTQLTTKLERASAVEVGPRVFGPSQRGF